MMANCITAWDGSSEAEKFPEAEKELIAAIQLKPDLGAAYGELAGAANETKNYDLVIKVLHMPGPNFSRNFRLAISCGLLLMTTCASTSRQQRIIISSSRKRQAGNFPIRSFRLVTA